MYVAPEPSRLNASVIVPVRDGAADRRAVLACPGHQPVARMHSAPLSPETQPYRPAIEGRQPSKRAVKQLSIRLPGVGPVSDRLGLFEPPKQAWA
jgi:hypothetical protein